MLRFFVKFCIAAAVAVWAADQAGAATPGQTILVEVADRSPWGAVAAGAAVLTALVGLEEFVRRRRLRRRGLEDFAEKAGEHYRGEDLGPPYQMPGESREEAVARVYPADPGFHHDPERRPVPPPLPSNAQARCAERLRRQRGR